MSTITAILDPDPDGNVHPPAPEELRHGKARVVATVTRADADTPRPRPKAGSLKGFWASPDFDEPLQDFKKITEGR